MSRIERSDTPHDDTPHDEANCPSCQADIAAMTPESLGIEPPPPLCTHDDPSRCDAECTRKRAVFEQWMQDNPGEWLDVDTILGRETLWVRVQVWWVRLRVYRIPRWGMQCKLWLRSF